MKNTITKAFLFFFCGVILISSLIFIPAGTFNYFGGILLVSVLFIPMFLSGIVMLVKSPKLLAERLEMKEKQKGQGRIITLSFFMFILGFIIAGLDFRFSISEFEKISQIIASIIFLWGYIFYFIVLYQNKYLSRTIKVSENQKVIDKGLYSVVRHPMYTSTLIMFLSMPIILGSYITMIIFLIYPFIISKRIILEEQLLKEELSGYKEYKEKVKYRLLPFIW